MTERMRRIGLAAAMIVVVLGSGRDSFAQETDASSELSVAWDSVAVRMIDGVETFFMLKARLEQGETFLISDRARDEGPDGYLFEGHVRIVERGDTIYADVVRYNRETKIGRATGSVRLIDGQVVLHSPTAVYDTTQKMTTFDSGVTMVDSLTVLESMEGIYWSDEERAVFTGEVRLTKEDLYMEADSVRYHRESEETFASGRVFVERSEWSDADSTLVVDEPVIAADSTITVPTESNRTLLFADRVYHDGKADSSEVYGHVYLLQIRTEGSKPDSMMVSSRKMTMVRNAERERVIATDSVSVLEGSFSVTGDSLVYDRFGTGSDEKMESRVFGDPIAWMDRNQITSDSLRTLGSGGALDSLFATGDVFVVESDSAETRFQQIKGRALVGRFESDSLRFLSVSPNAEALYFMMDDDGQPAGAIRTSADRIVFYFSDGEVSDIGVYDGVEGTYYPKNLMSQASDLSGFAWVPEGKPDLDAMRLRFQAFSASRIGGRTETGSETDNN